MPRRLLPLPILAAALMATGCTSIADDAGYPSLERRAVEVRLNARADSPAPEPPVPSVTADLVTAIAALEADAARGEAAFRAALSATRPAVLAARSASVGSAPWFSAQAAISGLDQTRGATRLALTELDRLQLAAELDGRSADAAALAAAAARVAALASGQLTDFTALSGALAD